MARIYLDHAASTPMRPEAVAAIQKWHAEFGNPSSLHAEGRRARHALDESREVISDRIGALFAEILFTSGGTEAANWAMTGLAEPRARILVGATEHHCVLHSRKLVERLGAEFVVVPVDRWGHWDLDFLESELKKGARLVAAMHANNEIGVRNPVAWISDRCKSYGARLYIDAVQTFAHTWTVDELGADLLSLSAHKVGGPQGVGALYVRAGTPLKPLIDGGGQEREMRAGTENATGIIGFGAAVKAMQKPSAEPKQKFEERLIGFSKTDSDHETILHGRFPGITAESLLIRLDRAGVAAGSGAACSSGSIEPSHVLLAMGWTEEESKEAVRFSFGWTSTVDEAERAAQIVNETVAAIRESRQR